MKNEIKNTVWAYTFVLMILYTVSSLVVRAFDNYWLVTLIVFVSLAFMIGALVRAVTDVIYMSVISRRHHPPQTEDNP